MVVLGGGAVSYERGTPVVQVLPKDMVILDEVVYVQGSSLFFFITLEPRVE